MSADEQKILQERLKNMGPEELREFQKQQCLFCQIIHGKVNSRRVYDDDKIVAVLDINPASLGHVLLVPREHYNILPQMNDDEISHLFNVAKGISGALLRAFQVQGTSIFVANGASAGQKAQHVMVHIIPRNEGDKVNLVVPEFQISEQNMAIIHKRILEFMTIDLGMQSEKAEQVEKPQEVQQEMRAEIKPSEIQATNISTTMSKKISDKLQGSKEVKIPSDRKVVEAEYKEVQKSATKRRKKRDSKKFREGMNIDDLADEL